MDSQILKIRTQKFIIFWSSSPLHMAKTIWSPWQHPLNLRREGSLRKAQIPGAANPKPSFPVASSSKQLPVGSQILFGDVWRKFNYKNPWQCIDKREKTTKSSGWDSPPYSVLWSWEIHVPVLGQNPSLLFVLQQCRFKTMRLYVSNHFCATKMMHQVCGFGVISGFMWTHSTLDACSWTARAHAGDCGLWHGRVGCFGDSPSLLPTSPMSNMYPNLQIIHGIENTFPNQPFSSLICYLLPTCNRMWCCYSHHWPQKHQTRNPPAKDPLPNWRLRPEEGHSSDAAKEQW